MRTLAVLYAGLAVLVWWFPLDRLGQCLALMLLAVVLLVMHSDMRDSGTVYISIQYLQELLEQADQERSDS